MKGKSWKIIGVVAMAASAAIGFVVDMVDGKKTESMIKDEVNKAVKHALAEKKG